MLKTAAVRRLALLTEFNLVNMMNTGKCGFVIQNAVMNVLTFFHYYVHTNRDFPIAYVNTFLYLCSVKEKDISLTIKT